MGLKTCIPNQAKADFLAGIHQTVDQYRLVLYTDKADIDENTTHYTPQGECQGKGYRKGGVPLHNPRTWVDRGAGCLTFDSLTIPNATITARGFMVINTSKNDRAVLCVDWGADYVSTEGPFKIPMAADLIAFE